MTYVCAATRAGATMSAQDETDDFAEHAEEHDDEGTLPLSHSASAPAATATPAATPRAGNHNRMNYILRTLVASR